MKAQARAHVLACMALTPWEKTMLLHQWIYPTLYLTLLAYPVQREELQQIIGVVKLALGIRDFSITMQIHTLPIKEGGSGLWEPKLYCHWVGSLAFV